MNRKVIKPVVLSGLFLAALIVFSIITNQDNKDMTTAMKEATLPIVQFYEGNNSVAQLHGYVSEMNITKMRDGIVPVDHTRLLPLKINTYGQKIRGIAYETGVLMIPGWLQREMHRRSKKKIMKSLQT